LAYEIIQESSKINPSKRKYYNVILLYTRYKAGDAISYPI